MFQWARTVSLVVLVALVAFGCEKPPVAPPPPSAPVEIPPAITPEATAPAEAPAANNPEPAAPAESMPTMEPMPVEKPSDTMNLAGTIGEDTIHMTLKHEGQRLVGSYSYDKDKTEIPIAGAMGEGMSFWFNESAEPDKITGTFEGNGIGQDPVTGTWTSADKAKTLPFTMSPVK